MKILITGICGFVGAALARELRTRMDCEILGIDNLIRPGSHINRVALPKLGIKVLHGDIRCASDIDALPRVDWVIDAAANPSVLAGIDGKASSRQLLDHNLLGTLNLLEYCKRNGTGLIILSTSRVYSIPPLAGLPLKEVAGAYQLDVNASLPPGVSAAGVTEDFSTSPPVSLYGASKLCSEVLALEYSDTFNFPVWIDRCGVLAGPGQFGRADQGIFSFWIHSWHARRPLKYIGFDGRGSQVRDALHVNDLAALLIKQLAVSASNSRRVINVAGGAANSTSLSKLSAWCLDHLGPHEVSSTPESRPFDIPWLILDSSRAADLWDWSPKVSLDEIFGEIAAHARENPNWLELTSD